ncbi:MAG: GDP-mannose 4,6-dehydratase [Candidatus Binatia bacterium]|nr:GDP-mannose 4,6-dehydratase [Candidatus Binatia bacterium]
MSGGPADRLLIIGGSGFIGRHLAQLCIARGIETVATSRNWGDIECGQPRGGRGVIRVRLDIRDEEAVREVLRQWRPRFVVLLAAQSSVAQAEREADLAFAVNLVGALHVFAAVRAVACVEKVVWTGSAEAYGASAAGAPLLTEAAPLQPFTVYGVSKAAADWLAAAMARSRDVPIVRARLFPCTGPGQSTRFVCADFAQQIALAKHQGRPIVIRAGNLEVIRDFTDVRDTARALLELAFHGQVAEAYNVCSATGRSIREVAETLLEIAGNTGAIVSELSRCRRVDIPRLVGCHDKITAATGWLPQYSWRQTLVDLLSDCWRRFGVSSTGT